MIRKSNNHIPLFNHAYIWSTQTSLLMLFSFSGIFLLITLLIYKNVTLVSLPRHVDSRKSFQSHHHSTIIIAEVVFLSSKLMLGYRFKKNCRTSTSLNNSTIFVASLLLHKL